MVGDAGRITPVAMSTAVVESAISRRRVMWGILSALVSVLLGATAYASAEWVMNAGPELLVYVFMPEWALLVCGHVLSALTALTALVLLLPPLVKLISLAWIRRLTAVLVVLAGAVAALPWSLLFAGMGLNAVSATYAKTTADSGESFIVEQSGFDLRSYSVYSQESWWLWKRSGGWMTATELFDPQDCTLAGETDGLVLRCGADDILLPPPPQVTSCRVWAEPLWLNGERKLSVP